MSYEVTSARAKLWTMFQELVVQIREGKRCILFAKDYVIISRNVYDSIIKEQYPDRFEARYDEQVMGDWLRERFLSEHKPNT